MCAQNIKMLSFTFFDISVKEYIETMIYFRTSNYTAKYFTTMNNELKQPFIFFIHLIAIHLFTSPHPR